MAALAAAYFVAAKFGLTLAFVAPQVTAVWPPTGLALAALLMFGLRLWPGVALGAFLANATTAEETMATAAGIAVGNTLEAVIGAGVLGAIGFRTSLDRVRDVVALVVLAACGSTIVSATVGVTSLCLGSSISPAAYGPVWFVWWLGDALGDLIVAPALLTLPSLLRLLARRRRLAEILALVAATGAMTYLMSVAQAYVTPHYVLAFAGLPLTLWVGLRLGQSGTACFNLLVSAIGLWGTYTGYGPFQMTTIHESLLVTQAFLGMVAITGLTLAATASERKKARTALRGSGDELELALDAARVGTWFWNKQTGEVHWSAKLEAIHGLASGTFGGTFDAFVEAVRVEDRDGVLEAIQLALETGQPFRIEYRSLHTDGTIHWYEGRGRAFYSGDDSAPMGMLGICMDITARKRAETAQDAAEARKAAVFDAALDAIITIDLDGAVVEFNPAAEQIFGYRRDEAIGQDIVELIIPPRLREQVRAGLTRYLATQDPSLLHRRAQRTAMRRDGTEFVAEVTVTPVATGGRPLIVGYVRDLTAILRTQRHTAAMQAVAHILADSSSLADAAPRILQTLCGTLGWDVGAVWLLDKRVALLRCVEVWHDATVIIPNFEKASRERTFSVGIGLPGRIWSSGQATWIADVLPDANFPRARIALDEGLRGAVGFPIFSGAEFIGVMEFFSREVRQPDQAVLNLMDNIGRQVSQFIERRWAEWSLHEREGELAAARAIQQRLLPQAMPKLPGFEFAAAVWPAQETAGDFYDFVSFRDGSLGIAIGDVSGHGIGAALLMTETRAHLRALWRAKTNLEKVLTLTNRRLVEDTEDGQFVTLLLACLSPSTRSLVYSNAGHWPGYVMDVQGNVKHVLQATSIPLGLVPDHRFPLGREITLEPGESLFLFTDGIVEALSPDQAVFGMERTADVLRAHRAESARDMLDALRREIRNFSTSTQKDDMTAILMKC